MFRSFRSRLIATVFALIAVTAGAVGIISYVLVRDSLRDQLVSDAVARAEFNVTVLAATEQLPANADRQVFEDSGLADRFLLRGTGGLFAEFSDGETFASSLGLLGADELFSEELRMIVARGEFGYEFLEIADTPTLVVAARRPPNGPDLYFFDSAEEVESAINQLARVLLVAGAGVLLLGALGAGLIAHRVLRPVAIAGQAATAMAAGDLSVRVPAETNDELGSLAVAFNRMATSLEDRIQELVEGQDRERRFVADVSHELRTPLTALVNEAAMLQGRLADLPMADQRIGEMLVADVARLRVLVEDLLEVSRLEVGSGTPDLADVDVVGFLEAVIAARHPSAGLVVDEPIAPIQTDRRSLERIVGNLLDNARRHAAAAPVEVTAGIVNEVLAVSVADAGPGVEAEELSRLFDRFYKTDEARQGGSGLGLAIARQHARRLGGELTVQARQPQGLVFELQIPVTLPLHSGDLAEMSISQAEGEETNLTWREP